LLERIGSLGVHSLDEVVTYTSRVTPAQRRKKHLANGLPELPGVYIFRDHKNEALYVGKSQRIRSRVRTYFTASETRTRMAEMVGIATTVDAIVCSSPLEALVREVRLITELNPRYNRRSKNSGRAVWVKLTVEPFPRLSVVREVRDDVAEGAAYLGPFGSRKSALEAMEALHAAIPLRTCSDKISPRRPSATACVLADMGRCAAPCIGAVDTDGYAQIADQMRRALTQDGRLIEQPLRDRLTSLSNELRYEEAAAWRDRLETFARGAARAQEIAALVAIPELIAARALPDRSWEIHVIRHGRLAGAGHAPAGTDPRLTVAAVVATAEQVAPNLLTVPAGLIEESTLILRWLESDGVRLVPGNNDVAWSLPAYGASGLLARITRARREVVVPIPAMDRNLRPAG
jgi:DNA polymerase-3 subunit epsilon